MNILQYCAACLMLMTPIHVSPFVHHRKTIPTAVAYTKLQNSDPHTNASKRSRQTTQTTKKTKKKRRCTSCEGKRKPLSMELEERFKKTIPTWQINRTGTHKITRVYMFKDFKSAMRFINKVAEAAEDEGHHPDIQVRSYNQVYIELYTHAISGLSNNDFYLAERIDDIWYEGFANIE